MLDGNWFLRRNGTAIAPALDWIIDQYQVSTDKRSGITSDLNRADDPQYVVRLIGQVITVSLETVQLVRRLNEVSIVEAAGS